MNERSFCRFVGGSIDVNILGHVKKKLLIVLFLKKKSREGGFFIFFFIFRHRGMKTTDDKD